ncbi:AraC family transcriptional regulator [Flavobacterium sp. KS-LB2]|uniref:helix-turn-helix domain-containing protein n=1 Tax=Flavobacterium sp. KS-LB2 TaxID=3120525 RepID=UPI0030CB0E81
MSAFINLFHILTGLFGLITVTIITLRYKLNRIINLYLIIIFLIVATKFLITGLIGLNIFLISSNFDSSYLPFFSICTPALYLYFKNIVADSKSFDKAELKHFILPLILGFCSILLNKFYLLTISSALIFSSIFILFHSFYILRTFQFLNKNIWYRKTGFFNINQQNSLLVQWTSFLFLFSCLLSIRLLTSLILGMIKNNYTYGQDYQWISGILLNLTYIKVLYNPKILYGYNALYKKIKKHRNSNLILHDLWIINPKEPITNSQDIILKEKISGHVTNYLQNIELLVLQYEFLRNPLVNLTDISNKLEIPKSHITFTFKYHSKVSFTEFKKIIRIYDAIHLIEKDYLKSNTLESLATKVGFSSYNPFFITFKDVTGNTPQLYNKEHLNS